ncbi:c-type cytochrome [Planctomicrobium sp. SH661]|uniref:c-type cytochrome n=1 Tax=Planctomicrobium sp. SH661 TaxID=3448124 RepID=UPI003F5B37DE
MTKYSRLQVQSLCWAVAVLSSTAIAFADDLPKWVWQGAENQPITLHMRKDFSVDGDIKSALIAATADNHLTIWVNGQQVLKGDDWRHLESAEVTGQIKPGHNTIAIQAVNDEGTGALLAALRITHTDGGVTDIATDGSWKASADASEKWREAEFDDRHWGAVQVLGQVGDPSLAWSSCITESVISRGLSGYDESVYLPVVARNVTTREGFVVEQVFDVPRPMGSWVALTKDDRGRLIASAQEGQGLFLIQPGTEGHPTTVKKEPVKLSGAQGLCWAFDALYAVVNGGPGSGLHRLKDTDGDGLLDADEFLMPIPGGGEHGPHAVIPSPDKKSLLVIAGNHTKLPEGITGSRIPQNWSEDLLLPRRWDAHGHAAGILAPGGWIIKVDLEAKQREIISIGFRNQYDIAFNADDELFTYDADMERDLGSPWYRPTRVCHVTSGSEFGWRSGTGKWPAYYEDSLPAVVDIGPGSPVGIVFGEGAKFPERYQRSLFLLDWTYSTIYAVHMTPKGATYHGIKEEFLNGQPMQVTDGIIGDDGALYFTTGGRGTQSSVYRVRYLGDEPTFPVDLKASEGIKARSLRHQLEAFHGQPGADLELIFAHLGSEDRFIRYAARIALESQPVENWGERALAGRNLSDRGMILAMIALSRQGKTEDLPAILEALGKVDFARLDEQAQLAFLRAYELAFTRQGKPDETWRQKVIAKLDPLYPAKSYPLNAELVQLLVFLNAPQVVSKTLAVMDQLGPEPLQDWAHLTNRSQRYGSNIGQLLATRPPTRAVHFAFVLRNQQSGWTLPQRQRYFQFLIDAAKSSGGDSYTKSISQFREDALMNCSPSERIAVGPIASVSLLAPPPQVTPPVGPGRKWNREEVIANLEGELHNRNFKHGRNLFFATACAKCHRLNGEGGAIGPDLSTAGKKFPLPDLLDAILEPSKVISDQYASHQVATVEGEIVLGRAVEIGNELYVFTPDADAPPKIFKKSEVEEILPSKISQMPVGLIDGLNPEELKDLLAYLLSGADPKGVRTKPIQR